MSGNQDLLTNEWTKTAIICLVQGSIPGEVTSQQKHQTLYWRPDIKV